MLLASSLRHGLRPAKQFMKLHECYKALELNYVQASRNRNKWPLFQSSPYQRNQWFWRRAVHVHSSSASAPKKKLPECSPCSVCLAGVLPAPSLLESMEHGKNISPWVTQVSENDNDNNYDDDNTTTRVFGIFSAILGPGQGWELCHN